MHRKHNLTDESKEILIDHIGEIAMILNRRFPKFSIGLAVLTLITILVLLSRLENSALGVPLKIASVFPLTAIVILLLFHYNKRGPAKRIKKFYEQILKDGSYKALRVKSSYCVNYNDGLNEYFLFTFDNDRQLLLKINDFSVDRKLFPNDNFIIPPYQLSDVVGNEIICEGKVTDCHRNERIRELLPAFEALPKGQPMITRKI